MVSFSADGRLLLSASNDGTVRQWRVESGLAPQGQPLSGHEDAVYAAAYNRDASMIVSGGEDGTVRLWDARSGQPSGEPRQMNTGPVWGVAFSPDGQSIAVATGARATPVAETWSNLILLDADARREKASLYAHAKPTMSLAFSPSGRYVVTGGQDSTVRVRDLGANQSQSVRLSGHKGDVQSVAFSPDGHTVASGSADKTVRLWLASSGEPLGLPLKGHDNAVTSVAFSPDGSWLASGGEDGTMQVWQLDASWATPSGQPAPEPPLPDPGDRADKRRKRRADGRRHAQRIRPQRWQPPAARRTGAQRPRADRCPRSRRVGPGAVPARKGRRAGTPHCSWWSQTSPIRRNPARRDQRGLQRQRQQHRLRPPGWQRAPLGCKDRPASRRADPCDHLRGDRADLERGQPPACGGQ